MTIIYKNQRLLPIFTTLGLLSIASINYTILNKNYLNSSKNNSSSVLTSGQIGSSSIESSISKIASKVDLVEISYRLVDAASHNFSGQGSSGNQTLEQRVILDNNLHIVSQTESKILTDNLKSISYQIISTENSDKKAKILNSNGEVSSNSLTSSVLSVQTKTLDGDKSKLEQKVIFENKENEKKVDLPTKEYYTILLGDSLSKIAQKYGVSYVDIAKANKISAGFYNTIYPGQVLIIPTSSSSIAKNKTVFSNVLQKTKIEPKVNKLESQLFALTPKNKKSNLPEGFIAKNYNYNWNLITQKSGEEIWDLRKKLGVVALGNLIGVKPGKCIPQKEERVEAIKEKYSLIKEKAKLHSNVLPEVLAGLMSIESGGNSKCISETGALGSKQLTKHIYNPSRAWYDGEKKVAINPFNDDEAIERSADLLSNLLKKYNGNYHFALSAYNQGENEVDVAIAKAKEDGITNSYEIVNNYLNEEGRDFSRKVLNATKGVKKELKSSLELARVDVRN